MNGIPAGRDESSILVDCVWDLAEDSVSSMCKSLVQRRCDIDLCTGSVGLRNMAADSFGENSCLATDENHKSHPNNCS